MNLVSFGTRATGLTSTPYSLNFGGVEENVVTRDEFPLAKAQQVLKNEIVAVIGYGVQGPGQALNQKDNGINVIVESNSLLQFVKPSLYVTVLDTARDDFKDSARQMLDRADVFVFRRGLDNGAISQPPWMRLPAQLLRQKPALLQREGEPLPEPLLQLVKKIIESPAIISL